MKVEIIFTTASKPKRIEVDDVYTKGPMLCLQLADGMIVKHPLMHVFSVAHLHGPHAGTTRKEQKDA